MNWLLLYSLKSTSNTDIVYIVELRHRKARLLGYDTHATYVLAEKMAKSPERVLGMLNELKGGLPRGWPKEIEQLVAYAKEKDGVGGAYAVGLELLR